MELNRYIDHTLLKPTATKQQILELVGQAREHNFRAVCVHGCWTALCASELEGSDVSVASVIGFPLGAMAMRAKAREAELAIEDGAVELDMVINIGALKDGDFELVRKDIASVTGAGADAAITKVIIETSELTDEEKRIACEIAESAGAAFVKTSTGFASGGATVDDVALMRRSIGAHMKVKASGGIRSREDAEAMISAGADRLGTSAGIAIVQGKTGAAAY